MQKRVNGIGHLIVVPPVRLDIREHDAVEIPIPGSPYQPVFASSVSFPSNEISRPAMPMVFMLHFSFILDLTNPRSIFWQRTIILHRTWLQLTKDCQSVIKMIWRDRNATFPSEWPGVAASPSPVASRSMWPLLNRVEREEI